MRQVGDRLIPVGVTSGRVHALSPEEAEAADLNGGNGGGSNGNGGNNGSRRSRRERRQQAPAQGYEQYIGLGGPDLEEVSWTIYAFHTLRCRLIASFHLYL